MKQYNNNDSLLLDDEQPLSFNDLCKRCAIEKNTLFKMINRGLIEPLDTSVNIQVWTFNANSLLKIQRAIRLQKDLETNLAGAVLALELLEEIKQLRQQVNLLQRPQY